MLLMSDDVASLFVLVSGYVYEIKLNTQLSSQTLNSSIVSHRIVCSRVLQASRYNI